MWPPTADALVRVQRELEERSPPPWRRSSAHPLLAGCHVCFTRRASRSGGVGERGRASSRGGVGERGWAAAVLMRDGRLIESAVAADVAGAPYEPGKLALREGPLLE